MENKYRMSVDESVFYVRRNIVDFYRSNDMTQAKRFVYDNCIAGNGIEEQSFPSSDVPEMRTGKKDMGDELGL